VLYKSYRYRQLCISQFVMLSPNRQDETSRLLRFLHSIPNICLLYSIILLRFLTPVIHQKWICLWRKMTNYTTLKFYEMFRLNVLKKIKEEWFKKMILIRNITRRSKEGFFDFKTYIHLNFTYFAS